MNLFSLTRTDAKELRSLYTWRDPWKRFIAEINTDPKGQRGARTRRDYIGPLANDLHFAKTVSFYTRFYIYPNWLYLNRLDVFLL